MTVNICNCSPLCRPPLWPSTSVTLHLCNCPPLWPSTSVTVHLCDRPPLWPSTSVTVHLCDRPPLWPSTSVTVHLCDPPPLWLSTSVTVHLCDRPPLWPSTSVIVHLCDRPPLWPSTSVTVHLCDRPPLWPSTSVTVHLWPSTSVTVHLCDRPPLWPSTSVTVHLCDRPPLWPSTSVIVHRPVAWWHCPVHHQHRPIWSLRSSSQLEPSSSSHVKQQQQWPAADWVWLAGWEDWPWREWSTPVRSLSPVCPRGHPSDQVGVDVGSYSFSRPLLLCPLASVTQALCSVAWESLWQPKLFNIKLTLKHVTHKININLFFHV